MTNILKKTINHMNFRSYTFYYSLVPGGTQATVIVQNFVKNEIFLQFLQFYVTIFICEK